MSKKRNKRIFYIIGLIIVVLFAAMMFLILELFNKENIVELVCVGVVSLLFASLCMALNTVVYALRKEER